MSVFQRTPPSRSMTSGACGWRRKTEQASRVPRGRLWAATRASGREDMRGWEGCWDVGPAGCGNRLNEGDRAEPASGQGFGLGVALLPVPEGPSPWGDGLCSGCRGRPAHSGPSPALWPWVRGCVSVRILLQVTEQGLHRGKGFYFCGVNNLAVGDPERPGLWWLHGVVETQAPGLMLCHLMTTIFVFTLL